VGAVTAPDGVRHRCPGPRSAVKVHGGVYMIARRARVAARDQEWLAHRQPRWSITPEDLLFSMAVWASGYEVRSLARPVIRSSVRATSRPWTSGRWLGRGVAAIHSARRGVRGESEEERRAFFKAARRTAANHV
jgi:hypothetical protein